MNGDDGIAFPTVAKPAPGPAGFPAEALGRHATVLLLGLELLGELAPGDGRADPRVHALIARLCINARQAAALIRASVGAPRGGASPNQDGRLRSRRDGVAEERER